MRLWLFRLIALCIPLLLLFLLEALLRLLSLGQHTPLLLENPAAPQYWVTNPAIINRYFPNPASRPNVQLEPSFVLKQKPPHGLRLVVQGGSTAAGYPYGMGASLAGMLEQRLRRTMPDRHIEVVNTALSAVNSYTLLDLSDEIIALQPDAVLIYAGHNEYLGLLGVGSSYVASQSIWLNRLLIQLRQLYLVQLLEQLLTPSASTDPSPSTRTLMAQVARHKHIALDSPLYQAGLEQFSRNMTALLQNYAQAGIPVYLATVASNIADQPPFSSTALSAEEQQQLKLVQAAELQSPTTQQKLTRLSAQNSSSADFHYQLGQLLRQAGLMQLAEHHLLRARDLDLLRFRAPSAINQRIRQLAQEQQAVLVETEAAFRQHAADGLIGNSLMLEHLHPNPQGYFVLADSFYQALFRQQQIPGLTKAVPSGLSWLERPLLPAEEHAGWLKIQQLLSDYPFKSQPEAVQFPAPQNEEQAWALAYVQGKMDWLGMIQRSAALYHQQKDGDMLVKALKILADALPHDGQVNYQAAAILQQAGRKDEARFYLGRAEQSANPPAAAALLRQKL
ncbi:SGNH/GDSL hydrolase family protein [Rheinheimera sp.]|uniref:SGNH/GDSL hydrolase family protein n=1 Tax=Rheinheimera sp. TaxID=1869214 RepID=UPI00307F8239